MEALSQKQRILIRGALAALLLLLVALKVSTLRGAMGVDIIPEYAAVQAALSAKPIYGKEIAEQTRIMAMQFEIRGVAHENIHPPSSILLSLPYGLMKLDDVYFLNAFLSIFILLLMVLALCWYWKISAGKSLVLFCLALYWGPNWEAIAIGQQSLIIAGFICSGWFLLERRHSVLAGLCFALAAGFKLFPAFLLLYLLIAREWKASLALMGGMLALLILSCYFFGIESWRVYLFEVSPYAAQTRAVYPGLVSLLGVVYPLLIATEIQISFQFLSITMLLLLSALAFFDLQRVLKHQGKFWAFSVCLIYMLLISPISWSHLLILVWLPAFALLFSPQVNSSAILVVIAFLVMSPAAMNFAPLINQYLPEGLSGREYWLLYLSKNHLVGLLLLRLAIFQKVRTEALA